MALVRRTIVAAPRAARAVFLTPPQYIADPSRDNGAMRSHSLHLRPWMPLGVILALGAATAARGEDFWCGDKIITTGLSSFQVRDACGPPAEVRARPRERHRRETEYGGVETYLDPPGEVWTYNFGSTRLMERLVFVDGVLVETTALKYGYDR